MKPDDDGLALWRAYRASRDPRLRDQLVERHLGVVKAVAAWVAGRLPSHLRLDDLYSAGMLGFLRAVEEYDPERGVEFGAYATPRIRGAIFDELRRLDCVPRRVRRRIREVQEVIQTLSQRLDRPPTDDEVAAALGIPVGEYQRLLGDGITLLSLDAPAPDATSETSLASLVRGELPSPASVAEANELRASLARLIERLPEREQQVLALYYYEELTMEEVGRVLGVTESRVSQIHSSAILRLRGAVRRERFQEARGPARLAAGGGRR